MALSRDPSGAPRPGSRRPRSDVVDRRVAGWVELDLFGEVDAELARRDRAAQLVAEFEARAGLMPDGTAVEWVAPYDTLTARRGQTVRGWRCWLCGGVEGNAYALDLGHGLHPGDPEVLTRTSCSTQDRGSHTTPAAPGGPAARHIDPRHPARHPDKETPR